MSRGPPSITQQQTRNVAATSANRHQPPNKRTQTEIPPGKQDFQNMNTPPRQTQTPPQQKKPSRTQPRKHNTKTAETRDRTGDLQIFSLTLSQLSYRGRWGNKHPTPKRQVARTNAQAQTTTLPGRLELPTLRLTASRSNQLSYGSTHTHTHTHTHL